ncbi:hypothetical protein X975_15167, partial [Stegodyphus mimosarum]
MLTPLDKLFFVQERAEEFKISGIQKLIREATGNMEVAQRKQKLYYDQKRRGVKYNVGDEVLKIKHNLSNAPEEKVGKFFPRFEGPFIIEKVTQAVVILKKNDGQRITRNVDQIKPFYNRNKMDIFKDFFQHPRQSIHIEDLPQRKQQEPTKMASKSQKKKASPQQSRTNKNQKCGFKRKTDDAGPSNKSSKQNEQGKPKVAKRTAETSERCLRSKQPRLQDENLPQGIEREFQTWLERLPFLNYCKISRRLVIGHFDECSITLHCFSDVSKLSYAACILLRAYFEGKASVQLVLCKSRVAPAKEVTVPRLELLGALIATRLYRQVIDALKLTKCQVYLWSDSSVDLTWIKKDSHWSVFVANRVTEIRRCTNPDDWHYVPRSSNAAGLLSRGCDAKMLLQSRWWEGPDWLKQEPDKWPLTEESELETDESTANSEKRKNVVSSVSCMTPNFTDTFTRFSGYYKNVRVLAWIIRFLNNSRSRKNEKCKELPSEEVSFAEKRLLYLIQAENFRKTDGKNLKGLLAFKDDFGLIRDLDIIDSKSLNRRVRYLQNLRNDLHSIFRNEYLAMLVHKIERKGDTLEVGDVVLIGTPEKRINWSLGLVVQVFPGADGHVRVAKVKTADGEKIRPSKTCTL